ncbi:MAG TPA: hypothetical protein PKY30_20840 [Myxococcota bacterium]|nr:hypothetical protein [Myxococcota bacterium]HNH49505.1 hypothetical protein [Myxococcota bacterium]
MSLSLLLTTLMLPTAQAAVLKGVTWSASSVAPEADGIVSAEKNLGDFKQATPWIEGEEGSGLGSFVKADFGADKSVSAIVIWAGCWYNNAYWKHYSRPKVVVLEFSDGSSQEVTLKDEFLPQEIPFASAKKASSIKIKVKSVYNGDAFSDTAISEVMFKDASPEDRAPVTAVRAGSTLAPDGDATYDARNGADYIQDSMWCEGNKTGDGTNEWMEFDFAASTTISQLKIRNGVTYSSDLFKRSNRAATATLTFSDGSTETIKFSDLPFEQAVKLSAPHTTSKVKITFTSVIKGTEFNDMCVSELSFLP